MITNRIRTEGNWIIESTLTMLEKVPKREAMGQRKRRGGNR